MQTITLSGKAISRLASTLAILAIAAILSITILPLQRVLAAVVVAGDDDFSASPINGFTGGTTATVYTNDTVGGNPAATGNVVPDINADGGLNAVSINADGTLTIPAGTAMGTYTVTYELCDAAVLTDCDLADVIVQVDPPVIDAVNDDFSASPIVASAGGTTATVFSNDTLNGAAFANSAVDATIVGATGGLTVTINTNGTLTIPAGAAVNTYTVTYRICQPPPNNANCDTADVIVVVAASVINAVNDDFSASPIDGAGGGQTATVFSNDTINGASFSNGAVTASITNAGGLAGVGINSNGRLTIPPGTTFGTYIVTYQICQTPPNNTNCDSATATVVVSTINAVNNNFTSSPIDDVTGGTTATVFNNDTLNGSSFSNSDVNTSITNTGGLTGVSIGANGRITVPPGTAISTYIVTYQICESANPTNCDTATATIRVGLDPTITKSRSTSSSVPGGSIVYTLVVRNPRTTSVTNVVVADPLDDFVDFVSSTTTRGTRGYDSNSHVVVFAIGTLTAGQSATMTITVRVASDAARPSTITNAALLDTTQTNAIVSNTVNVSVPAASTSPTSTPAPTATSTSGIPGQLPDTGEQMEPFVEFPWAVLAVVGASLVLLIGLAIMLILRQYDKAAIMQAYHRISKWIGLGILLTVLGFAGLVALKPGPVQTAEVSPALPGPETTEQPPADQGFFGLIPGLQAEQPSATATHSPTAEPPAKPLPATHIIVPALNLDTDLVEVPVVDGKWDVSQLAFGVAHLEKTAYPGTKGNAVLAGHVLTKRGIGPFYNLEKLEPGDIIIAEGAGVTYTYEVEWIKVVSPSDVDVAMPSDSTIITLLTCTKWNSETRKYDSRLAVRAKLVNTDRQERDDAETQ